MAQARQLLDKAVLKSLVPTQSLNEENFQELAGKAFVEEVPAGRLVFKKGDTDRKAVYVLSGEVELVGDTGTTGTVKGGSPESKHAIANQQPRQVTVKARNTVTVTRIDSDLLDILLTWDQLSGIEVVDMSGDGGEEDDGGDWMTRILQSKGFLRIPPANIQHMFMRLQEMPVKTGQAIITQGENGDYYYIICRGRCKVKRESASGASVTLAQLSDGDAFGEEALLSASKRNATIIMETDGLLMRLSKDDFEELLKAPILRDVELEEAKTMVAKGAILMDVRMESEHKAGSIRGSVNVPLLMLRLKADGLDKSKTYICYCETGRRSSAAAFLLSEQGFDSVVLKGGLQSIPRPS
jgi:CRP-like cAMP-binding protein